MQDDPGISDRTDITQGRLTLIRESFDYVDYLDLKKAVDDRSLNMKVWQRMADWVLANRQTGKTLRVLEIGAGIGTMTERLLESGLLMDCDYTAVELEPGFSEAAKKRQHAFAQANAWRFESEHDHEWTLIGDNRKTHIRWVVGDAMQVHTQFAAGSFDLIIGHAVIDLLPVPLCMPDILSCLRADGAFYFSLNYAGETLFLPSLTEDDEILAAYNRDMDKRFPQLEWRPSQTGQILGPWLVNQGHHLLAEGDSDWKLMARPDEPTNLFIANIIDTIETALTGMPGLIDWLAVRRQQLLSSQLQFRATNRDCFGLKGRK